jgi:hypothetical protein
MARCRPRPGRGDVRRPLRSIAVALLTAVGFLALLVTFCAAPAAAAAPPAKVEELCKALLEDSNYKVRVQAALVLGRLGDAKAIGPLTKALEDANKTVRAIAAQALGQLGDGGAADALRALLRREADPFVKSQTEKALAALAGGGVGGVGGVGGIGKKAKIYLSFGPFTGTSKAIGPEDAKIIHDVLQRELAKLQLITTNLSPADQKGFAKTGMLGFYIDGNITRLDDSPSGGSFETSCDVKVLVARWPSKSIILWTNAGASLQSGARARDKENARRECLEASAGQLSEDLTKFFKSQGG